MWLDETVKYTVASSITSHISAPAFEYVPQLSTKITPNGSVTNESLWVYLSARREISISSTVIASNGTKSVVSWNQELFYLNIQNMTNPAYNQSLSMASSGNYSGSFSDDCLSAYSYPLNLYSSYVIAETDDELSSVFCMIDRSLLSVSTPAIPALTGTLHGSETLASRQNVTSFYTWNEKIVEGIQRMDTCDGETWYSYSGVPSIEEGVPEFSQYLRQKDNELVLDEEYWATMAVPSTEPLPVVVGEPAV